MRFEASQHMKLGQQMKLAPRMIQSMEILQMPLTELEERITQELESNPTLELAGPEDADARQLAAERADDRREDHEGERRLEVGSESGQDDFERLERFERDNPDFAENELDAARTERVRDDWEPGARARLDGERDAKMDAMASAPARAASLVDQLLDQWRLAEVAPDLRAAGELLISFVDDDGFLRTPLETVADRAPADWRRGVTAEADDAAPATQGPPGPELLATALAAAQEFLEPAGVLARDRRECLLLQVDALRRAAPIRDPALEDARVLIEGHLEDLSQNKLPRIAERSGLPIERINAAKERMRGLSLAPARRLVDDAAPGVTPDAIVEYDEEQDRYAAYLNETRLPNLQVNREYALMARDRAVPAADREFLKKNLSNAQWLLDALGQRRGTLLRVLGKVVEHQRDFFDYGPQAIKPLPMTQVAEELGIHVATVSRAVSEKWVQTPRGVWPLRKFFTGGLATEGGGEMSYDAVRAALTEVVAAEDKAKPLSDDAIADALRKRGIEIARRTVAKYRDQLNIPPARLRKAF